MARVEGDDPVAILVDRRARPLGGDDPSQHLERVVVGAPPGGERRAPGVERAVLRRRQPRRRAGS
jgi:hypothetical protein